MALITFPDIVPNACWFQLRTFSRDLRSPITGTRDSVQLPGTRWTARLEFVNLENAEWRELEGFVSAMRGRVNTVLLRDFRVSAKRGQASGTITVTGAAEAQTVTLAGIGGGTPSFRRGDLFTVDSHMHQVLAEVTHSGGSVSVAISPPLRAAKSAVEVSFFEPKCLMQLASDDEGAFMGVPGWDGPEVQPVTINFVEAL